MTIVLLFLAIAGVGVIVLVQLGALTRIQTDNIKFRMNGESLARIIHDKRGKHLDDNGETDSGTFVDGSQKKSLLNRHFGLWWVGIPGISSTGKFWIHKKKENPNEDSPLNEWVLDLGREEVDTLRGTFPHPYLMLAVELIDGTSVNVLMNTKFEVVKPGIPVIRLKGDFFTNAGSIINGATGDILNNLTIMEFVAADKGEVNGILAGLKSLDSPLNEKLIEQVGLRLVGISISRWDPADEKTRQAIEAKKMAELEGAGHIAEATAEATALTISSTAKQEAGIRLAEADAAQFSRMVAELVEQGVNPNVAAEQVSRILAARAQPSLTTRVDVAAGGQMPPVTIPLPPPEKK
ncbi:MAG: hypothetical protein NTX96_00175 [Candidatus Zambryskibacteria bacterium]|nr:hypothetical protein [Candidatus Zambryskibacteria bacterium]